MKCSICEEIIDDNDWVEIAGFVHHRICGSNLIKHPKIIKRKDIINDG